MYRCLVGCDGTRHLMGTNDCVEAERGKVLVEGAGAAGGWKEVKEPVEAEPGISRVERPRPGPPAGR